MVLKKNYLIMHVILEKAHFLETKSGFSNIYEVASIMYYPFYKLKN